MNFRAMALLAVLAALGVFVALNWAAFNAPTLLTLGFAEVSAPLGLIMLVVTGMISGLFLTYILFQQAGVILEARRYAKDLKTQRELADKAEASRFTELRAFLEGEMLRRIERHNAESAGTLSAHLGEIEDKLDRLLPSPPPR